MRIESMRRRCLPGLALCALFLFFAPAIALAQSEDPPEGTGVESCRLGLCFRSSQYYLVNYKRLRFFPRDIFISGVNLNHPVDCVSQPGPILFALRANSLRYSYSPLAWFNQQYVTAQLTMALVPLLSVHSITKSPIGCYGLNFQPIKLSTGAMLTPNTSLQELFTLCDVAGTSADSEERDANMTALGNVLALLNGTCQ